MVGSVAWWSTNHVAYVEQVVDANTIVISEDHYGGQFDWRRIVRAGGGWPTGFIHLNDEVLAATAPPVVSGTPKVDAPLKATPGSWNLAGAAFTYQWFANGTAISGANGSAYIPTASQLGAKISVKVGASRSGYRSGYSTSPVSSAVAPGTMRATANPVVTGLAKVGGVLTVAGADWQPAASSQEIAWYADGVPIPGATTTAVKLGPAQLGHRITAVITGSRAGYLDSPASSAATEAVAPENLAMSRVPTLSGVPHVGQRLAVTPGDVSPSDVTVSYRWMRDGAWIKRAKAPTYTPTPADLGAKLSVRVVYAKDGYRAIGRVLALATPVRSSPAIKVRSRSHRSVTVTVAALGVANPGGTITIVNTRGERKIHRLVRGRTTFSPAWIHRGKRTFTVIYSGSPRVDGRTTIRALVVK
jgi:hypothetical protein